MSVKLKQKPAATAADVMTREPICVDRTATVHEIATIFAESEISGVPVVDLQNRVVGIVSKTDILNACLDGPPGSPRDVDFWDSLRTGGSGTAFNPEDLGVAEDLMRTDDVTVRPDDSIAKVAARMARSGSHRVIVTDADGHPLGIVTSLDLVKLLAR